MKDRDSGVVRDVIAEVVSPQVEVDTYEYVLVAKNGHVMRFVDDRKPSEVSASWKIALAYPLLHDSLMDDEEMAYADKLMQEDPRRFKRNDARIFLLRVGLAESDDAGVGYAYNVDPREILAIVPADSYGPPGFDEEDDEEEEDDDGGEGDDGGGGMSYGLQVPAPPRGASRQALKSLMGSKQK